MSSVGSIFHIVLAPFIEKDIQPQDVFWYDTLQFSSVVFIVDNPKPVAVATYCTEPDELVRVLQIRLAFVNAIQLSNHSMYRSLRM